MPPSVCSLSRPTSKPEAVSQEWGIYLQKRTHIHSQILKVSFVILPLVLSRMLHTASLFSTVTLSINRSTGRPVKEYIALQPEFITKSVLVTALIRNRQGYHKI